MRSILVVVTRQIGDVLLTTPLIRAARQRWPGAAIDVLGFQGTLGMLKGNPDVRQCITTPPRLGLAGGWGLARALWNRYDLALVADIGDRAHLIGWVAARGRAGILPARNGSNWWKKGLLQHVVIAAGDLGETHVVQEKLALLSPWMDVRGLHPEVVPPPPAALPAALQARLAPGHVVVHAPSMWPYKQWPPEHFGALIAGLAAAGRQVVLTGGPSEADRRLVASLLAAAPAGQAIDAGLLDFSQLVSLLAGSALYIGPDTSVSHLAAACGIPVLAIFGPTNPQRWAPWPSGGEAPARPIRFVRRSAQQRAGSVTVLQDERDCVPCGKAGCEDHRLSRSDCLPSIRPERVTSQALQMLEDSRA
ncbi:glycosyltransferase family 9 protein [Ramlibacter aquaticus]|uniref:Glycosyltransferase family 9 protein n=1 Tax=Ramlibacter aquaticus TaxID=2780094 RepID=A0ABR9SAD1_9BURK|nr:glycosyltransferase family 9 protein [Ramlibacter aquaticus]MBE7939309.1 glycosyltransferase family 9 protein [Ramlibacter aquaticus]